ncbi:Titin like protein [Argiope bruennichi]|uniref:Titin like protein n=1 Tax=Argiope bruennichi TaxID=94029 RepID=A0A8T0E4L2_ARGBR|nr:Titin like protein [Argiope bruennichi]
MCTLLVTAVVFRLVSTFVTAGPGEPKIKTFHFSNELELGMRESVHCNVLYGDTPFEFSWFKDGKPLKDVRGISVRKTDDYNSNLVISQVDADSNGNYTCRVTNSKGFDEKSAVLSVREFIMWAFRRFGLSAAISFLILRYVSADSGKPKIKPFHFSNFLELDMRESVQCTVVSGDPPFEFSWSKDGRTFSELRDISVHKTDNFMSTLIISKRMKNGLDTMRCDLLLFVVNAILAEVGIPKINPFHFSGELDIGMRASVQCAVIYGDPPFQFSWVKDGKQLANNHGVSIRLIDDFTSTLVISKVDADSNGNYTCKASNMKGFDEKSAILSVKENGAPKISPFHFPGELVLGKRTSVICVVNDGEPPFEFTWFKNEKKLVEIQSTSTRKIDDFTSNLVISKLDADSNGNYTCRASNSRGFDEKSALLSVRDSGAPKVKSFHFSNVLELGMREMVHCIVMYGDPPFEFTWYKDGQKLAQGRGISIAKFDEFTSNLIISKVEADSNGNYTCRASNSEGYDEKSALLSVKESGAPKINPFHFSQELNVGMRTSILCAIIYGDEPFEFTWFKDGQKLSETHAISIKTFDDFTSTLAISKVDAESNGNYTCRASNSRGFDEKSALLSVKDNGVPRISPFHFPTDLDLGMRTSILCVVNYGDPPFEFTWFKNGQKMMETHSVSIRKIDDFTSNLVISKVDADSNGNYTCRASNSKGFDEKFALLSVKGAKSPEILPFHFMGDLSLGKRVTVACSVIDGDPPFEFVWLKDGVLVTSSGNIHTKTYEDDFQSNLIISKLDSDSNGNYTCKVSNAVGKDEHSAVLLLKNAPKVSPFHFPSELDTGMRASVHCIVMHGDPPFEFSWFKDGQPLREDRGISVRKFDDYDSNLVISKVDATSNGNYSCRVTNSEGLDEKSAVLSVKGAKKPEIRPFHFTGDLSLGKRVTVACSVIDGDPPFQFTWFKDNIPVETSGNIHTRTYEDDFLSNLIISKLESDSNGNYTCRVLNAAGKDEHSAVLLIKDMPKMSPIHFPSELDVGMRASVHCIVLQGEPPFEFSWFKDGQPLILDRGISIRKTDEYTSNMVIAKVNAESNGNYSCRIANSEGHDQTSAILSVKGRRKPEIRPFHFSGELVSGKRVVLACSVMDGDPPLQFRWYKDGTEVGKDGNVHIKTYAEDLISNLIISQLDSESNGNYTCRVTNEAGKDEHSAILLLKGLRKPEIRPFHFSGELVAGKRVMLACSLMDGDPPFQFKWYRNDAEITMDGNIHSRTYTEDHFSNLIITQLDSDSNGVPEIGPFLFPEQLNAGMRASVQCAVTIGDPPFEFTWYKDSQKLVETSGVSTRKIDDFTSNLVISKVEAGSNGNYTCKVSNSMGFDSKSAVLSVKDAPKLIPFHFSGELDTGMRATVVCAVMTGNPPFEFSWFKDGKVLDTNAVSIRKFDDFTSNLVISKLEANSNGNYTCKVSNSDGFDEKSAVLSVKDVPKIGPIHFAGDLDIGMRASVQCAVMAGSPPFEFIWFKNGQKLVDGRGISIRFVDDFTSSLAISKVDADSNGNYSCRVSNSNGNDEKFALLSVKGLKAPKIKPFHFTGELNVGLRTVVLCAVIDGSPPFNFQWLKDGQSLISEKGRFLIQSIDEFTSILTISDLDSESNGNYTCRVSNSAGSDDKSDSLNMRGSRPPKIKPFHFSEALEQDMRTAVMCVVVGGDSPFEFKWFKDGRPLPSERGYFSVQSLDEFTSILTIKKLDPDSNGNYTCRATNSMASDEKFAILMMKGTRPPRIKPFHFSGELSEGLRTAVMCVIIDGGKPFDFKWFKDGEPLIPQRGHFSVQSFDEFTSILTIEQLNSESNGNYTCRVTNVAGKDEKSDVLMMKDLKPPKIMPFHFSGELNEGLKTAVMCLIIDGERPFDFKWFKDNNRHDVALVYHEMANIALIDVSSTVYQNLSPNQEAPMLMNIEGLKPPTIKPFHFSGDLREGLFENYVCADYGWRFSFRVSMVSRDGERFAGKRIIYKSVESTTLQKTKIGLKPPKIKPFNFSGELSEGLRTMVMCGIIDGDLPFEFSWFKDGTSLSSERGHFSIETLNEFTSILTIKSLSAGSNGNYTCRVTNAVGSDEKSDVLMMKEVISAKSDWVLIRVKLPSFKTHFHFSGELREGLRTMVMCGTIDGDRPFKFQWFKDGKYLLPQEGRFSIESVNEFTSFLTIEHLSADSNGNYSCRVSNSAGSDEQSDVLMMKDSASKPNIGSFRFSGDLTAGKRTVVLCVVVEGDPPFHFAWSKDGAELQDNEQLSIVRLDDFTSTLSISKLNANSNGNYSCKVSNGAGFDIKYDTLRVDGTVLHLLYCRINESDILKYFSCSSISAVGAGAQRSLHHGRADSHAGLRHQRISQANSRLEEEERGWWRNNGDRQFPMESNGKRSLCQKIDKGDEGVYTCEVSNGVGETIRKSARLDVKAPPRISSAYRIKSARKAESATLVCEAEGDQPLMTSWAKNGIGMQTPGPVSSFLVQINEELSATGIIAQLTILSTHRSDGGSYTCSAKNRFGEVNNTVVLRIVEPPERPVSVKVGEVWSRAATVSWSPPFDGNSPITQYLVHYWKDIEGTSHRLQERNVPATQTSVLLGDLQPGTTYLLRVVAENDVGRGESSEPFKLRTEEEAPSAPPTDVAVIATGPTSVSITWKAPPREHWNGRLLGYYVGYKRHQSMEPYAYHTVPAGRSTHADYRLTRLQKATRYSIIVKAFNSVGSNPESHELLVETSDKDSLKPPHLYVSETSDTTALLEWEHPRDLPENVFTHYMVYYRPGSEGSWHSVHVPAKDKRFKLTSLESGTKYQVYLTAYSESGVSDPSDTLTLLTEGKAMAPSIVSVSGDTPYFLKLHFIIPVAASIVIIVIVIVVAWVWVKKAQFRDEREAARVSLYAEAYYTLPHKGATYFAPPAQQIVAAGGPNQDDAYDVPWDLPARPKM